MTLLQISHAPWHARVMPPFVVGKPRRSTFAALVGTLVLASAAVLSPTTRASAQHSGGPSDGYAAPTRDRDLATTVGALVEEALTKDEPLRVIIEFDIGDRGEAGFRPFGTLTAQQAEAQQAAIAEGGSALIRSLGTDGVENPHAFTSVPQVAVTLSAEKLEDLAENPRVLRVHRNEMGYLQLQQSVPHINADDVLDRGYDGAGQTVAIIDSGVNHPDLNGRVVAEACYSSYGFQGIVTSVCPGGVTESTARGSGRNCPLSTYGCDHGTHVAGIAASSDGMAPAATIIAVQVMSQVNGSQYCPLGWNACHTVFDEDMNKALDFIFGLRNAHNIAAVNISIGGGQYFIYCNTNSRAPFINNLRSAGIPVSISSGNNGWNGSISAPACIESAVAVGSTLDNADVISSFSNHATMVDVLAPGSDITSTVPNNGYDTFSGTSMAAPHLTGIFALLKSANPSWTVDRIENALKTTGVAVSRAGISKPRIDVLAAFNDLQGTPQPGNNDAFANAEALNGASGTVTGSNVGRTGEAGECNHAGTSIPLASVWYTATPAQSGQVAIDTFGSDYDTTLAVYTGNSVTCGTLTAIASNDDADGTVQSEVSFDAVAGTTYRIAVDGYDTLVGNIVLNYQLPGGGGGGASMIYAERDAFINAGKKNAHINEGGAPYLHAFFKRVDMKEAKALIGFPADDVRDICTGGISRATLGLWLATLKGISKKDMGLSVYPVMGDPFVEGNGMNYKVKKKLRVPGSGPGVTWNCPSDPDVAVPEITCTQPWNGGSVGPMTDTLQFNKTTVTNPLEFDITEDLCNGGGISDWLVAIGLGYKGKLMIVSREGANMTEYIGQEPYLRVEQ